MDATLRPLTVRAEVLADRTKKEGRETPPRGWLRIARPERFRHYHHRPAPRGAWAKIPRAVLFDYDFLQLPEATRAHAVYLVAVADNLFGGRIPDDANTLAWAIGATVPVDVEALVRVGVLERVAP